MKLALSVESICLMLKPINVSKNQSCRLEVDLNLKLTENVSGKGKLI